MKNIHLYALLTAFCFPACQDHSKVNIVNKNFKMMIKWSLFITIIGSFYIFVSCTGEKVQNVCVDQTLAFDETHVDTLLWRTVEKINFLALDTAKNSDVHGVDKMVVKNNLIFIGDFHTGKIVVYDMNGKVKFVWIEKELVPKNI